MLYTKHRKIQKAELTGAWGNFDTWDDFGETWGDWEYEWQSYTFAWLKVPYEIQNVLKKVDWEGYEGLKKYLGELLPESFYRRWGWCKWDEIFKEKLIAIVFSSFLEPILIQKISLATYTKFSIFQLNVNIILNDSFTRLIYSVLSCSTSVSETDPIQVFDSYKWSNINTWRDFPNGQWRPLW
jgi:hypothetical protein